MPLTEAERNALKKRSTTVVSGFRPSTLADEFRAMADWCEARDADADHYGDGAVVADFEARVASLLGKSAAVVVPSGVAAQLAAVRIWCERAGLDRFGLHPTSHLAVHEEQAYAALMRLHAVPIGSRLRPMTADDLGAVNQRLACAIVELPIREAGGKLPSWDALDALKEAARRRDVPLHMDGARLWESAAFYGRSHADIASGFASVYVSLYKGIGGFAGAVLAGDDAFVAEARLWRRRMGGTLHRLAPFVVSAAMRFDERIAMMPALFERARTFARALASVPGLRVEPAVPDVNMLHLYVDAPADAVLDARDRIADETGTWLVDRPRDAEVPGWSFAEIYVGDPLLSLDDAALVPLFARLVADARGQTATTPPSTARI